LFSAQPVIGNLGQIKRLGRERLRSIVELVDRFGTDGLATIYLANRPFIFITDFQLMKKVLNDEAFTGRPLSLLRDGFFQRKGQLQKSFSATDSPKLEDEKRDFSFLQVCFLRMASSGRNSVDSP
jgi:hypothetical protein